MTKTDEFFIPENEVRLRQELDYCRVGEYVNAVEAFSRLTYQSVYIISCNLHIIKGGRRILIKYKLTPLALTSDGGETGADTFDKGLHPIRDLRQGI